ncbi:hypothetical protein [Haloglomus halophilum]|uniref:hypothetical protein n=1 Tax=Haloglomus halophilum TaxID=2962672 RepID=UPI0020C9E14A|nr:hypothetical protein [Haloglomus halophilum]
MTLLNALYSEGVTTLTVEHPSPQIDTLLRIDLGDDATATVRFPTPLDEYRETREQIQLEHGDAPYSDLPDPHEFVAALTGCGLVELANREAVDEYLEQVCYPAIEAGDAPLMIGIDANIFPWGFPEQLGIDHVTGAEDAKGRTPTNGYALSNGVVEELRWQYTQHHADALVAAFGDEFERLAEQPGGAKRAGRLGIRAYQSLIATRNVDLVHSEKGDSAIVDGYVRYDEAHYKEPLLLSNDRGFINQATEAGLAAQRLAFKSTLPHRTSVSWRTVAEALYSLAMQFGVVRLPKVTLYGVWTEKDDQHWRNDEVDITFRGSQSSVRRPIVRHRRIATEYDRLM